MAGQVERLWGLTAALTTNQQTGLTGGQYTAPLREDMLRALSQAEPPDTRNGLAKRKLTAVGKTLDDLFGAVTIVNPGGSYTLATRHTARCRWRCAMTWPSRSGFGRTSTRHREWR